MGLGLLGGDMVRQLQSADSVGEKEKKLRKLQKVRVLLFSLFHYHAC